MKIYHYILIAILALIAWGCSDSQDMPIPAGEGGYCDLIVSVNTEIPVVDGASTRAGDQPWDDPYPEDPGIPSEYAVEHMSVYFVTPGGSVFPFTPTQTASGNSSYTYSVKIDSNASYVSLAADGTKSITGRIVAIANYPDGVTPADPFSSLTYPISAISTSKVIPMWGVTSVNGLQLVVDGTVNAGEIKLLRSVPKITIKMADEFKDLYKITSVIPDRADYPSKANCFPTGGDFASSTGSLMIEGCFNPAQGAADVSPSFYNLGTENVWCYTGERNCPLSDGVPLSFTVTLARKDGIGTPFSGKVYLCDYNSGQPDFSTVLGSLVRNHDYEYKISLSELEFVISFKEWVFGGKVHVELE